MLNGHPYMLVGVDLHQDSGVPGQLGAPVGYAQTDAELQSDINMVLDLGATVIRTSHYQDNQALYAYCDQVGLMVYTEVGLQGTVTSTTPNSAFVNNLDDQLTEMVKQNYDHPSIFAWGLYNELGTSNNTLIQNMSNLVHVLDPTRYTSAASNQGSATDPINAAPDLVGRHFYDGWYGGVPENMSGELDSFHNANPTHPMGITEYGSVPVPINIRRISKSRRRTRPTNSILPMFNLRLMKDNGHTFQSRTTCGRTSSGRCSTCLLRAGTKATHLASTTKDL